MQRLKTWFQNPKERRQVITATSGFLILGALLAGRLLETQEWRNGLMIAAALIAGWDIGLRAWHSLKQRHISIELLVTVAAVGALLIGEVWEAAAVTFLFMLGAYLEARTLNHTRQALQELLAVAPTVAVVLRSHEEVVVAPHEVQPGETVLVKPGAKIPVDGEVIRGRSVVDESAITGEPIPAEKEHGNDVFAGTINQDGLLYIRTTGMGADTTLARIIRRVEEAQEEKAPTQRFIERFGQWYTPAIIALGGIAWLVTRDLELALTLLVIGCPGALVISTPVSVVAGLGRAARRGILIKGGEYLENAGKISALAFDKTGTLTEGRPELTDILALQVEPILAGNAEMTAPVLVAEHRSGQWTAAQEEVLHWAAIAENGSEHPLARPIVAAARDLGLVDHADQFDMFTGRGVRAAYGEHVIVVGNLRLMDELEIAVGNEATTHLTQLKAGGKTAVLVALDGIVLGVLGITDPLRATAPDVIQQLKKAGMRLVMLTGDDEVTARAIADEVGVEEIHARLLPEHKLDLIRRLQADGHVVAMVGDGINDAPALAAADIGMAMGAAGTDIAIETADIALMTDNLAKIDEAIRLSKATLHNIRQNLVVALMTAAALLVGVLLGEVHMAGGMFVHEVSVLVVIGNGMRLLRA